MAEDIWIVQKTWNSSWDREDDEDRACVEEVFFIGMEEADKEDFGVLATFIGQHESLQSFELLLW